MMLSFLDDAKLDATPTSGAAGRLEKLNWNYGDVGFAATLAATAVGLALESLTRGVSGETALMGAAALGLFLMLGAPWHFRSTARFSVRTVNVIAVAIGLVSLLIGVATDLLMPLSLAWSSLLWAWLDRRLEPETRARAKRLLLLTLLAFAWVDVDLQPVNWIVRVTSAMAVEPVLNLAGLPTIREGAVLRVASQVVEITQQCAGGETLHAMLIVGVAAAFVYCRASRPIWPWLPVLGLFTWVANSLRVLLISLAAAWAPDGRTFAFIHDAGGWLVVALMLGMCVGAFAAWSRWQARRGRDGDENSHGKADAPRVTLPIRRDKNGAAWAFGTALVACLVLGGLWRFVPLRDASDRLARLPETNDGRAFRELEMTPGERERLGDARGVKRLYRVGGRDFMVTVVDGTKNRRAVHDPTYCWTIMQSHDQALDGGQGAVLRVVEEGVEKDVLFWFSDGRAKHASPVRYLLETSLRRATLGWSGAEPLLVLVEPADGRAVNWYRLLDDAPWLATL